jgi:hypothetical protein
MACHGHHCLSFAQVVQVRTHCLINYTQHSLHEGTASRETLLHKVSSLSYTTFTGDFVKQSLFSELHYLHRDFALQSLFTELHYLRRRLCKAKSLHSVFCVKNVR